jgi:uncharacterized protein (TIGR03083 family)
MELQEHIEALRAEGMSLADSAEATGFEPAVPTCPEWTVRDLVRHVGEVHRWALSHVALRLQEINTDHASLQTWPQEDAGLIGWFREGHANLLQALETNDPDVQCWSFLPNGPTGLRFWARRQAHETAIHRVDSQSVTGEVSPAPGEFAVDGINEMLHGFFARRPTKLTSPEPVSFELVRTDGPGSWHVRIDEGGPSVVDGSSETTVHGTAFELYLLLWNRRALDAFEVNGPLAGLDLWRAKAKVKWF